MTCRSHDWKPELLHTHSIRRCCKPFAIDYLCRKCGAWRRGPYDAAAWNAHVEDVCERIRWDAALSAPSVVAS